MRFFASKPVSAIQDIRTYAKMFQQSNAPKTVHLVRRGAWAPLGRFCV